jgi:hypothetical protein
LGAAGTLLEGAFDALAEVSAASPGGDGTATPVSSFMAWGVDEAVVTVAPTAKTPAVEPSSTALPTSRLNTRDEGMVKRSFFQGPLTGLADGFGPEDGPTAVPIHPRDAWVPGSASTRGRDDGLSGGPSSSRPFG